MATRQGTLRAMDPGLWSRYTTMVLGAWFFMSGLIWYHAPVVGSLDWMLGLVIVGLSVLAVRRPGAHWLIAGVGAWILLQSVLLPHVREGTVWNERISGALVLLLGLIPRGQIAVRDS